MRLKRGQVWWRRNVAEVREGKRGQKTVPKKKKEKDKTKREK